MNVKILRTRTINVLVNSVDGSVEFKDQPDLRNAFIQALEIFTAGDITGAPAASGTVMPVADMKKCTFTLYEGDLAIVFKDPVLSFHRLQNSANDPFVKDLTTFDNLMLSWDKCTVDIAPSQQLSAATYVIPLRIYFIRPKDMLRYAQRNAGLYALQEKYIKEAMNGTNYLPTMSDDVE